MIAPENPSLVPVDDRGPRLERVLAHNDSELMLRRVRPNDPLRASAESIKKATEWGIALGQQILATNRKAGPPPVPLNQVVANVAKVLRPAVGDRIELVTRLDADATESADRQAPTVLVVEDERDVRELICEILQFEKYTVLDARDRDAALTVVESHAGPIDLLITDIVLPGVGGDDLAQRVVAARPGTRVVYVSGHLEAAALPPAQRLGPLLSKPITVAALAQTVREALNGRAVRPATD
jgi:CheY-like chemotaxis protein